MKIKIINYKFIKYLPNTIIDLYLNLYLYANYQNILKFNSYYLKIFKFIPILKLNINTKIIILITTLNPFNIIRINLYLFNSSKIYLGVHLQ